MEENIAAHLQSLSARFDRWSIPEPNTGCFIWLGKVDWAGYGHIKHRGRDRKAATVAYEEEKGLVPKGLVLDHRCKNRICVNVAHLEAVTQKVNWDRGGGPAAIRLRKAFDCKHCGKLKVYMAHWARPEWVCPDVNMKAHRHGAK